MKHIITILTLFICTLSIAQDWTTYNNEEFEFSIDFPGTPQVMDQKLPSEVGELTMDMFVVDQSDNETADNMIYMVVRSEYPIKADDIDAETAQGMLDGSVNGAVTNVNGKLVEEKKVELNGIPGRKVKIEVQGAFMYLNIYLKKQFIYAAQVICMADKDKNTNISKFFESFKINKN